jgi:drug/metabolite transporter (DMT)-like permease
MEGRTEGRAAMAHAVTADSFIFRIPHRPVLVFLVTVLGTVWGLQYATAKFISLEEIDSFGALFAVHVLLGGLFAALLAYRRAGFLPGGREAGYFACIALLNNVLPLGAELLAARRVSAGELTLVISLTPVCVLIFAQLLRSEAVCWRKAVGILCGCGAGSAILLPAALAGDGHSVLWLGVAFIGPISAGLGAVLMARHWPKGRTTLQVATGNLIAGTLILTPLLVAGGVSMPTSLLEQGGGWAVVVFAITVGLEFYLLALITRLSGAAFASCSDFVAICAGLAWGYLFFAEVPTRWMLLAALLCLGALRLASDRVRVRPEVYA